MKPVGFWRLTSTRRPGKKIRWHSSRPAKVREFRLIWNGHDPEMAVMSGSSSKSPIPAVLARKMGCALLTQTMERRHHLGLDSYDRFFPNQDTLPKGGFGNLIALPLQWMPRQNGNSLFVDDDLRPYPDQWQLLLSIRRVGADQVEWIVNDATRRGQVMGVKLSIDR